MRVEDDFRKSFLSAARSQWTDPAGIKTASRPPRVASAETVMETALAGLCTCRIL